MIVIHFCIDSFDPRVGGMEESALRVARLCASEPDIQVVVYVLASIGTFEQPPDVERVVDIGTHVEKLLAPIGTASSGARTLEETRIQVLLLRNAVRREVDARPGCRHLVMSFFVSTAGFVAQHVACELDLAHVACARGSDLGRDVYTRQGVGAVEFVVRRASRIVTTNLEHRHLLRGVFGRGEDVHTIYNSLPPSVRPSWRWRGERRVRLVSLGGYSVKKGTMTLVEAAARLLDEGFPVELAIAGPAEAGSWRELKDTYAMRYGRAISMADTIDRDGVEAFLLGGDVFCSASLSEGCSNATMLALGLGMPIVSTSTGALVDLASGLDHVRMARPADAMDLTDALRGIVQRLLAGTVRVDPERLHGVLEQLSPERERTAWLDVVRATAGDRIAE